MEKGICVTQGMCWGNRKCIECSFFFCWVKNHHKFSDLKWHLLSHSFQEIKSLEVTQLILCLGSHKRTISVSDRLHSGAQDLILSSVRLNSVPYSCGTQALNCPSTQAVHSITDCFFKASWIASLLLQEEPTPSLKEHIWLWIRTGVDNVL